MFYNSSKTGFWPFFEMHKGKIYHDFDIEILNFVRLSKSFILKGSKKDNKGVTYIDRVRLNHQT